MKKSFKVDKSFFKGSSILFDETTNSGFHPAIFTGLKKLSKDVRDRCLSDLGSGSETEYQSAKMLYEHQDKSPRFLDWLIECCEKDRNYLHSSLCWAFTNFQGDERVLPAIIKSISKCPDNDLGNYVGLLGLFGGKEAKEVLRERFYKLKDNPQTFIKGKNWNDLGFSLLYICETLLELEPDNIEAAECLARFARHPNSFNQEVAVTKISVFFKTHFRFRYNKTREIFANALKSLSRTNKSRLFGLLLPYLFQSKPEQTYQKFKRIYLKTKKEDRYNHLAFSLIYSVENPLFWICKLVRELSYEDSEYFRDYLNFNQVTPISTEELISVLQEEFASESPSKRASAVNNLKNISDNDARKILKEALIDEPDKFIRRIFEKELKKLS